MCYMCYMCFMCFMCFMDASLACWALFYFLYVSTLVIFLVIFFGWFFWRFFWQFFILDDSDLVSEWWGYPIFWRYNTTHRNLRIVVLLMTSIKNFFQKMFFVFIFLKGKIYIMLHNSCSFIRIKIWHRHIQWKKKKEINHAMTMMNN